MKALPEVSVLMPCYDPDPRLLGKALASLRAQTLQDWECLVLEDEGPRGAAGVLEGLRDPRIRHLRSAKRLGMAGSRNLGLEEARAPLVAVLDADDLAEPDRLRLQRARFAADPDLAVCGTAIRCVDATDRTLGFRGYPVTHEGILAALPRYNPIAHPSVMMRRKTALKVGGYRDRVCEDYDLWSRLARAGARFANLPDVLLRYRIHDAGTKWLRLRDSLRDTIAIKGEHWRDRLDTRGRLRLLGERILLRLPPRLVLRLFRMLELRRTPS